MTLMLYLEIEKTRLDDLLTVKFKIEPQTDTLLAPSLLSKPLVENSIKYAIARMPNGGLIEVSAKCQRGYLHMEVADNGPAQNQTSLVAKPKAEAQTASSHTAVGIQNTVDRLDVLYPNEHDFNVICGSDERYRMQIPIPMEHS
jgi:two-component system LytT family sensor kinase